jgi:hypothetical protein
LSAAFFNMVEANYFHSTVYRFEPGAYNEVIRQFNTSMQDVSARCWYDVQQDVTSAAINTLREHMLTATSQMFCLTSPESIGQQANSSLNEVLCGFIEDRLAEAEREDVSAVLSALCSRQPLTSCFSVQHSSNHSQTACWKMAIRLLTLAATMTQKLACRY